MSAFFIICVHRAVKLVCRDGGYTLLIMLATIILGQLLSNNLLKVEREVKLSVLL